MCAAPNMLYSMLIGEQSKPLTNEPSFEIIKDIQYMAKVQNHGRRHWYGWYSLGRTTFVT